MEPITWLVPAGLAVGLLYGLFGVGSAFATPVLSILGVPGLAAVAGPLPGLLPGSAAGAWSYAKGQKVDIRVATWTLAGAFPAAIGGAFASRWIGGPVLLLLSGTVLLAVGVRVLRPVTRGAAPGAHRRREDARFVAATAVGVGFLAGLLANGGGFLLVPMFLLVLGLDMNEAAGTSMVVAAVLTLPTVVVHAAVGNIDWNVSIAFAAGLVPGTLAGSRLAQRLPLTRLRHAFGVLLCGFAAWFIAREVVALLA